MKLVLKIVILGLLAQWQAIRVKSKAGHDLIDQLLGDDDDTSIEIYEEPGPTVVETKPAETKPAETKSTETNKTTEPKLIVDQPAAQKVDGNGQQVGTEKPAQNVTAAKSEETESKPF